MELYLAWRAEAAWEQQLCLPARAHEQSLPPLLQLERPASQAGPLQAATPLEASDLDWDCLDALLDCGLQVCPAGCAVSPPRQSPARRVQR